MSKFIKLSNLSRFWNNIKTYIDNGLAGKSDVDHTHNYAASSHTHEQSAITGLTTALAGKAASSHNHEQTEINGLDTALAGKAASSHTHEQSEITGLVNALAGKAASSHTHSEYAASSHTHSDYALKSDISTVYRYKGSVTAVANLPTGASVGDVYNVEGDNGQNYAWTGTEWDSLGGSIQIEVATDEDIDALFA